MMQIYFFHIINTLETIFNDCYYMGIYIVIYLSTPLSLDILTTVNNTTRKHLGIQHHPSPIVIILDKHPGIARLKDIHILKPYLHIVKLHFNRNGPMFSHTVLTIKGR